MRCFQDSTSELFSTQHLEVPVGKLVSCSPTSVGMRIIGMLVKMQIPEPYHWGPIWKFRQSEYSLDSEPCLMLLVCRQLCGNHSLEAGVLVSFRAALAMDLLRTSEDKGWIWNQKASQGKPQTCMNEWMRVNEWNELAVNWTKIQDGPEIPCLNKQEWIKRKAYPSARTLGNWEKSKPFLYFNAPGTLINNEERPKQRNRNCGII